MTFLPSGPFRQFWRVGAICAAVFVFAMPGAAAAQPFRTFSSSQFIPNGGDCNYNGTADRSEAAHANRDDDGDGICNGVDQWPLEVFSGSMQAITVPADAGDPMAPHVTYSGATTTLKGIARYGGNQFMWDFGDGTPVTAWTNIADPYNLGRNHVYTGAVGQEFTATLMVRNSGNLQVASATYPVVIKDGGSSLASLTREQTDVRAQMAFDKALWYLHTTLTRGSYGTGAPGYSQGYATTFGSLGDVCAVTAAFASHGHVASRPWEVQIDEFGNGSNLVPYRFDPYVETSRRLINYMLANSVTRAISAQPAGNPDVDGNGKGVSIGPDELRQNGLCAMAFAESAGTEWFAQTGPANVYGRSHTAVSQDLVDWLAYGQADGPGSSRGGWTYQANAGATNDVLRWVVLALGSQQARMDATVPSFVRSELAFWLNYSQYSALDPKHGSWGYAYPNDQNTVMLTAGGLLGRLFVANPAGATEMQGATGYIARAWLENDNGWHTNLGDSHAMSAVAQAFRTALPPVTVISDYNYVLGQPDPSTAFNWYYGPANARQTGYAGNLLARQNASGWFSDALGAAADGNGFSLHGRHALAAMVLGPAGAAATATASLTSLDFGLVDAGAASPAQAVTLTNDGELSFAFDSITATGPFVVTSNCGSLLAPAGEGVPHHCTLSVTFSPVAGGAATGLLTVAGSPGLPATTIALSGVGTAPKLTPAISWPPSAITYGTMLDAAQLNATADVAGTFAYLPAEGATLDAGTGQLLAVTFTPTDSDLYASVTTTTFVDVAPASPTVTVTAATVEYDGQPHSAVATATGVRGEALGPITITYDGQSAVPVSAGTYAVVAGVAANGNYTAASASASLVISKATPVVAWPAPLSITYGAALDNVSLNASASVPGTFTYTPAPGTVLGGGAGQTLTVTFAPDDALNFDGSTATTIIDVLRATPTVTVAGRTYTYDGQAHATTASATGVNGEPLGSLNVTYNGQPAAPAAAGDYAVVATVAASTNYEGASATATIAIGRALATVTAASDSKVYGTADPALAPVVTGFLPADGIVVTATRLAGNTVGSYATHATASGAALDNYEVVTTDGLLTVTPAALIVTANNATRQYNTPNPVLTGTLATVVAGDAITATYTTAATVASPVGPYAIAPALLDPAGRLANYAVTLVPGTLTVAPVTNSPPVCSAVVATPVVIWPANGQWININLSGATDPEGGPLRIRIASIFQDEPTDSTGDGNTAIDGRGIGTSTASVRAERLGNGNGRAYRIAFEVIDQGGLTCTGGVTIGVPHNQKGPVVDDGPRFDSTVAAPVNRPRNK